MIYISKIILYIIFIILSFSAGKIHCQLNKINLAPSKEVWYKIMPLMCRYLLNNKPDVIGEKS